MNKEFVSDLEFEDEYFAQLIRGDEVDAKILDIEIPELPEDYYFFSAKDIPGKNKISFFKSSISVFAEDKIEYSGQAVGILIGKDIAEVHRLSKLFNLKIHSLKPSTPFSFEEEDKNYFDYPSIGYEELNSDNLNYEKEYDENKKEELNSIENIFDKSPNIVYSTYSVGKKYHFHSETACIKTNWQNSKLNIHLVSQWPFNVLNSVGDVLNISKEKVNIVLQNEGESLNGKIWFSSLLATQVALASYLTKKNISLEFSRKEDFLYTPKAPSFLIQHKTAISKLGKIIAMSVSIIMDAGDYNPFVKEILKQMVVTSGSFYYLPKFSISATAIKTNSGLTGLFSGWGDSIVTTALEKHINEIVEQFHLCPIQFRFENAIRVGQKFIFGIQKKKDFAIQNLLKAVCNNSDFYRKYYAYRALNKNRKDRYDGNWRGIGLAVGFQYNGSNILVKSGMNYRAEITLTKENKAIVKAEPTPTGFKKILKKQIAKELELEDSAISFLTGSTDNMSPTGAETASSGLVILPELISRCCTGIKNQRFRKALPITVNRVYTISAKKNWDNEKLQGTPFVSVTLGACAVELELEPSTYKVRVKTIWLSTDPGKIYSKKMAIRSLNKSIINALSSTSIEKINEKKLATSNYKIISTENIPDIKVFILDDEIKSKGLGELAFGLLPAAYISALNQILIKYKRIDSLPVLTKDIFYAIQDCFKENIDNTSEDENEN